MSADVREAEGVYLRKLNTLTGDGKQPPLYLDQLCRRVSDKKHWFVTNANLHRQSATDQWAFCLISTIEASTLCLTYSILRLKKRSNQTTHEKKKQSYHRPCYIYKWLIGAIIVKKQSSWWITGDGIIQINSSTWYKGEEINFGIDTDIFLQQYGSLLKNWTAMTVTHSWCAILQGLALIKHQVNIWSVYQYQCQNWNRCVILGSKWNYNYYLI